MEDLKIFDENGKALHIADVIARFLKTKATELEIRHDGIKVGIEYAEMLEHERLYITGINGGRIDSFDLNVL